MFRDRDIQVNLQKVSHTKCCTFVTDVNEYMYYEFCTFNVTFIMYKALLIIFEGLFLRLSHFVIQINFIAVSLTTCIRGRGVSARRNAK